VESIMSVAPSRRFVGVDEVPEETVPAPTLLAATTCSASTWEELAEKSLLAGVNVAVTS
jgi:hypothetical protein